MQAYNTYQNIQKIANPVEIVELANIILAEVKNSAYRICTLTGEITNEQILPRLNGEVVTARFPVGYLAFGPRAEHVAHHYFAQHPFASANPYNNQLTVTTREELTKSINEIGYCPAIYEAITLVGTANPIVSEALAAAFEELGFICDYCATRNYSFSKHINDGMMCVMQPAIKLRMTRDEFILKWTSVLGNGGIVGNGYAGYAGEAEYREHLNNDFKGVSF